MKIRYGFVSNSSSTSYAILLPDNAEFKVCYEDETSESAKRIFEELKASPTDLWLDSIDLETQDALIEGLKPYIIGQFSGGPDEGQIIQANKKKVKEILGNE